MTKAKNAFSKIFLIFLMLIMCITLSACGRAREEFGDDFDDEDWEDPDSGEGDDGSVVDLFGVKVLRKPLVKINEDGSVSGGYDFDSNVTDKEGNIESEESKDFFYSLSKDILELLFTTYGNFNSYTIFTQDSKNQFDGLLQEAQNDVVEQLAADFADDTKKDGFKYWYDAIRYPITSVQSKEGDSFVVTADNQYAWKWSLPYNTSDYPAIVEAYKDSSGMGAVFGPSTEIQFTYEGFLSYYSEDTQKAFNATTFHDMYNNEDYVDALAYSIYSIVLGTPRATMTISYASDGAPTLMVDGFDATSGEAAQSSASRALSSIRQTFKNAGAYVGLTSRNKAALRDFILTEVIGAGATGFSSPYTNYHYYDVVDAIVQYCSTQTITGAATNPEEEGGGGTTNVGEPWLASEVVNYPRDSFFVYEKDPDNQDEPDDPFKFTEGAFEYQSFVLMPSVDNFEMSDLWLDFKYDAGRDGDEIFDPEKTLEIDVIVRWNKGDGTPIKQLKDHISVKDGPADIWEDGTTLCICFDDLTEQENGFGETVKIGKFNEPAALKGLALNNFVVTLNGLTDARRYYQVLDGENGGVYGVLNDQMIEGSYCEVAFDVKKTPGDYTTNYAFYMAIDAIIQGAEYPNDPEWH